MLKEGNYLGNCTLIYDVTRKLFSITVNKLRFPRGLSSQLEMTADCLAWCLKNKQKSQKLFRLVNFLLFHNEYKSMEGINRWAWNF